MNPSFLSLDEVVALHASQCRRRGVPSVVRDLGMLESALAVPPARNKGGYLHPTLPEMAAAYLFHLAQNHPFEEGNLPLALLVCLVFLDRNGLTFTARSGVLAELCERVGEGRCGKSELAIFLRDHTRLPAEAGAGTGA